jgi:hypothetical protein
VYLPSQLERAHNFARDGRYSERGWACTPPLCCVLFTIMMECTPESDHCQSICTLSSVAETSGWRGDVVYLDIWNDQYRQEIEYGGGLDSG